MGFLASVVAPRDSITCGEIVERLQAVLLRHGPMEWWHRHSCLCSRGPTDKNVCATNCLSGFVSLASSIKWNGGTDILVCVLEGPQTRMSVPPIGPIRISSSSHLPRRSNGMVAQTFLSVFSRGPQ